MRQCLLIGIFSMFPNQIYIFFDAAHTTDSRNMLEHFYICVNGYKLLVNTCFAVTFFICDCFG